MLVAAVVVCTVPDGGGGVLDKAADRWLAGDVAGASAMACGSTGIVSKQAKAVMVRRRYDAIMMLIEGEHGVTWLAMRQNGMCYDVM